MIDLVFQLLYFGHRLDKKASIIQYIKILFEFFWCLDGVYDKSASHSPFRGVGGSNH